MKGNIEKRLFNQGDTAALSCPLCGSSRFAIHHSLRAEEIFRSWALDGHHFSDEVLQPLQDEDLIHLYDCLQCGFQFFNPRLGGGAEFYEQISAGGEGYYAPSRPENERNAQYAVQSGYRKILDVGCGTGFALDVAKRLGLETFGIELSGSAAAVAASRGHTIFPVLLEKLDPVWEGKFDLISLNQLLEHVPDPIALIQQCRRFLSAVGVIAIAVPNATGILRFSPWLHSNWPPHHLSRWKTKDFYTLAQKTSLRVIQSGGDPLLGSFIELILLEHRQRCRALGKPYHGLSPFGIKFIAQIYRKSGLKFAFKSQGHSIYCFLAFPPP